MDATLPRTRATLDGARRAAVPSRLVLAALALLAPVVACRSSETPPDPAAELRRLERVLADTADLHRHPELTDADLDPLRQLPLRDPGVAHARAACVRQYEAMVQTHDANTRCEALEDMLQAWVKTPAPDAGDPGALIDEAKDACARSETLLQHVLAARRECDEATGALRRALGEEPRGQGGPAR